MSSRHGWQPSAERFRQWERNSLAIGALKKEVAALHEQIQQLKDGLDATDEAVRTLIARGSRAPPREPLRSTTL